MGNIRYMIYDASYIQIVCNVVWIDLLGTLCDSLPEYPMEKPRGLLH